MAIYFNPNGHVRIVEHTSGDLLVPAAGRRIAVYSLNGRMETTGTIAAYFDGVAIPTLNGALFGTETNPEHVSRWHGSLLFNDPDPPDRPYVWHWIAGTSYHRSPPSPSGTPQGRHVRDVVPHVVDGAAIHRIGSPWATGGVDEVFSITASSPFYGSIRWREI
jgi:hypothetical protein